MATEARGASVLAPDPVAPRVLGRIIGPRPGPTLVCVGGLHGNEPAGVRGLERVLATLAGRADAVRGDFVAVVGNRTALGLGRRFVDRDLNRAWTDQTLGALRAASGPTTVEDREQVELLHALEEVVAEARGPVYVLDLHTTSGPGGVFSAFDDTLANRRFAALMPVPMILGLEELVEGTLLGFLARHGMVTVALESGQHEEEAAVDRAEAGVWISLAGAGLLPARSVPELEPSRRVLRASSDGLPRALEMRYRHPVEPGDAFRMEPGYQNFQVLREGRVIAHDRRGPIAVQDTARLLMPLYQEQGEDGYFLVREFSGFWLTLSAVLRRMRVDAAAGLLPGVRRDPTDPDSFVVDRRVARWFALQLFHLLGYRRIEEAGPELIVRRRRTDEGRFMRHGPTPRR